MDMVRFCLKCGDEGIQEALIFCTKCKLNAEHYYCLDELPKTFDLNVQWLCHECKPGTSFGRSCTILMTTDDPTLHHVNSSLTVAEEKIQKGLSSQKTDERMGHLNIISWASVNESDYTTSSRSVGDTDDEWDDKSETESSKKGKHREDDVAWTHAVKITEPKKGLVCKYCSRAMIGRGCITRLKEHLAGGYDFKTIKACPKVPLEVKELMKKTVEEKERAKAMLIVKARSIGQEITDFAGRLKVRKDPAWEYAYPINGRVNSMVCKFCSKTVSGGGITRFKRHLSEKCLEAPPEVQIAMEKMLIKKDVVASQMDARVDKIKREMREKRERG